MLYISIIYLKRILGGINVFFFILFLIILNCLSWCGGECLTSNISYAKQNKKLWYDVIGNLHSQRFKFLNIKSGKISIVKNKYGFTERWITGFLYRPDISYMDNCSSEAQNILFWRHKANTFAYNKRNIYKNNKNFYKNKRNKSNFLSSYLSPCEEKLSMLNDGKDRSGRFILAELGGKVRWMEVGRFYDINRIDQVVGGVITLHRISFFRDIDGSTYFGRPFICNMRVWCRVLDHFRGPKRYIVKQRPKKWHKAMGHRQELSRVKVEKIEFLHNDCDYDENICKNNMDETQYGCLGNDKKENDYGDINENREFNDFEDVYNKIKTADINYNMGKINKYKKDFNFCVDDPLYTTLMAIRRAERPSIHLSKYKNKAFLSHKDEGILKNSCKSDKKLFSDELKLLGTDPLQNFDPVINQFVFDRISAGKTDVLPILTEGQ